MVVSLCAWQLLIQEQVAENQRESQLLQTTDPAEQLRLETVIFAQQRAEASDRIIAMTEAHEQALQKRKAELEAITLPPVSSVRCVRAGRTHEHPVVCHTLSASDQRPDRVHSRQTVV